MTLIEWLTNYDRLEAEIIERVRVLDFSGDPMLNDYAREEISRGNFEIDFVDSEDESVHCKVYRGGGYFETFRVWFEELA